MRTETPRVTGKGWFPRIANGLRSRFPKPVHFMDSLLGTTINDRYSSSSWKAVFSAPNDAKIHDASDYADAISIIVNNGGILYVSLQGYLYLVMPNVGSGFDKSKNSVIHRNYDTYSDYVSHQASKLDTEGDKIRAMSDGRYKKMKIRFGIINDKVGFDGPVLCLGSRLGEEVRVFGELGLLAVGVDLNPGENNPYTLHGDFHDLKFPDSVFGVVYSNVLDHVFDIDKFMTEAVRVIRPDGLIYFNCGDSIQEAGAIDPYGAMYWESQEELLKGLSPYTTEILVNQTDENGRAFVCKPNKVAPQPCT